MTAAGAPLPTEDPRRQTGEFRADLEGLRAVAVGLVLLYHAGVPRFDGGYVGVDVFFVLSGFLITGLLIRELSTTGTVSLPAFYARRARRLLPAAAVTLIVTVVASAVLLPPLRMGDIAADTVAAGLYASNIRFAVQATDYLASELAPSPVLHFWSLGVEEQFYLFWPALLLITAGSAFRAGRREAGTRRVGLTLAVVFGASLALAVWLTGVNQPWAFFSLPTRAWELALGGLLALPVAARILPPAAAPLVGWVGVAAIAASGVVLDESTPFPGTAALLPTLGTAMVILAGLGPGLGARLASVPGPASLLALGPLRYIGRISYSLYLWHWPILVLPVAVLGSLPLAVRLGLAGLAIVVAAASQRWIEEPIRHGRFVGTRPRRVLALAGALTLIVATTGVSVGSVAQQDLRGPGAAVGGTVEDVDVGEALPTDAPGHSPQPAGSGNPTHSPTLPPLVAAPVPADLAPPLAAAREDLGAVYADGCIATLHETTQAECAYGDIASDVTVVLFGDSHAAQWFPPLERLASERSWRLVTLTKGACSAADLLVWSARLGRQFDECTTWREAALDRIAAEDPALILIASSHQFNLAIDGEARPARDHADVWAEGIRRTIERMPRSAEVVWIGDTPRHNEDPPVCLSAHLDDASQCATPFDEAVNLDALAVERAAADAAGAAFIDPTPWLCPTDPCPTVMGRFLVFHDAGHMTRTFARALARPLAAALPEVRP